MELEEREDVAPEVEGEEGAVDKVLVELAEDRLEAVDAEVDIDIVTDDELVAVEMVDVTDPSVTHELASLTYMHRSTGHLLGTNEYRLQIGGSSGS